MQRISVYIPEETKKRINLVAKAKNKAESEIIRIALEEGLSSIDPRKSSAQALLDFAKEAKKLPSVSGEPTDVAENHDYYAWGGLKRNEQ